MASANEVKVSYIADIRDLTEKLKSVTGITASEARAQVAAVVAGQKAQQAALKATAAAAGAASETATKATTSLGAGADKALKAFGPLGGIISHTDAATGQLASGIAGLTGAFDAVAGGAAAAGLSMGALVALAAPVAAGVALISLAYLTLTGNLDDAVTSMDAVDARNAAMAATASTTAHDVNAINALRVKLQDQVLIASGNETSATQTQRKTIEEINVVYAEQIRLRQAAVDAAVKAGDGSVTQARRSLEAINEEKNGLIELAGEAARLKPHDVKADEAAAKKAADKAAADAQAAQAANAAALAWEARKHAFVAGNAKDITAQSDATQKIVDTLYAEANAAKEALLAGQALADFHHAAALQSIDDQEAAGKGAAGVAAAADAARSAENERYAGETKKNSADSAKQRISDEQSVVSATAALGAQIVSATTKQYDTTTAAGRKAAIKQFNTQKAANLAIGAINTAVAVSTAIKDYPVPPLSFVMAGIALASGLVAEAAIAAAPPPSFHAGGLAPDEVMHGGSVKQPGEGQIGVISKQGMATMRDANAGMRQGPQVIVSNLRVRHQTLDTLMHEVTQRGGRFARDLQDSRTVPLGARSDSWRR